MARPGQHFKSQADRFGIEYREDQFGRTWVYSVELKTREPSEAPRPTGWTAPANPAWADGFLVPPSQYLTLTQEAGRTPRLHVDVAQWLADVEAASQDYNAYKRGIANNITDPKTAMDLMRDPTAEFLDLCGPAPMPGVEFLRRMAKGDKWTLGLSEEVPAWAYGPLKVLAHAARKNKLLTRQAVSALEDWEEEQTPLTMDDDEDDPGPIRVPVATKKATGGKSRSRAVAALDR